MITSWINTINTTSLRIVTSIACAALLIVLLGLGVMFFHFEPTDKQMTLLYAIGGLLAAMMALDVAQFVGKRFSDATLAAAKNPTQPVSVDTPTPTAPAEDGLPRAAAPVSEGVGAPAAPAQPAVPDLTRIPAPEKGP